MKFKLKPQQNHHLYVPLIIHLLTGMDITVVKQTRKDQLSWELLHKMKLMMEHVTVWISTDKVDVANLNVLLAHMDLDVLIILWVNNSLISLILLHEHTNQFMEVCSLELTKLLSIKMICNISWQNFRQN